MYSKETFSSLARRWASDKKPYVKRSTLAAYSFIIKNYLSPRFSRADELDRDSIQKFALELLDRGLSLKTTKDILQVAKMIYNFKEASSGAVPALVSVRLPSPTSARSVDILSRREQNEVLGRIAGDLNPRSFGVYLSLTTGLRIGEVCALTWRDFDLGGMFLSVRKTVHRIYEAESGTSEVIIETAKTQNSVRRIPILIETARMARLLAKEAPSQDCFILSGKEEPLDPATYRAWFRKYMETGGCHKLKFHSLRHTFATRCIESGGDPKTVSVLLGHANVGITMNLYVHPTEKQKRAILNRMMRSVR